MTDDDVERRHLHVGDQTYLPTPCGWVRVTGVTPVSAPLARTLGLLDRELSR